MDKSGFEMAGLAAAYEEALAKAEADGFFDRLMAHDATLWKEGDEEAALINNALGWLALPVFMSEKADEIMEAAREVQGAGFTEAVLLGMGGSSLAPLVMSKVFGRADGWPRLTVLDSTDPAAIDEVMSRVNAHTLFIVSSKSGSTVEPNTLFRFFYDKISNLTVKNPGANFIAVTDPGSSLEALGAAKKFRHVFLNPSDIGGRFSALSYFGLVPAALTGVDIKRLLTGAKKALSEGAPASLSLGAALGTAGLAGRDKVTLVVSKKLPAFGLWVEQLIAESTGKEGRGLVPVTGEPVGSPGDYRRDRVFVDVRFGGDGGDAKLIALAKAGNPVIRLCLSDTYELGYEFMRWEIATALAGRLLGINPFDQPDVESAKILARQRLANKSEGAPGSLFKTDGMKIYLGARVMASIRPRSSSGDVVTAAALRTLFENMEDGAYIALLTYYSIFDSTVEAMVRGLQATLMERTMGAVQAGFGPRYLHSTGQIHKGGPNSGIYLIFTHQATKDVIVPDADFTFSELELSQAYGDMEALDAKKRRVILFESESPSASAMQKAVDIILEAVS